jgi:hypothetical protein
MQQRPLHLDVKQRFGLPAFEAGVPVLFKPASYGIVEQGCCRCHGTEQDYRMAAGLGLVLDLARHTS